MTHDGPVLRPLGEPLGALPRYGLIGGSGVQVGTQPATSVCLERKTANHDHRAMTLAP